MGKRLLRRTSGEDSDLNSEIRKLKNENKKLKKQLAQSRKQVVKLLQQDDGGLEVPAPETIPTPKCPKCNSASIREIELGAKTFVVCGSCKHRRLK